MKSLRLTILLSLVWLFSFAQSQMPVSLSRELLSREVPIMSMPALDVETLMAEDEVNNAQKIGPYRFGQNMEVSVNAQSEGLWEELKDGSRVWRMGFRCEGAYSVNFIFNDFYLPFGSRFHIYNENGETIYGPFSYNDNRADNGFATFPIPGELVFIELYEPVMAAGQSRIQLQTVTHGYRDIFKLAESRGGGSGSCNINVNCPEGDDWQDHKRSVAIMVSGGSGFCTGAMVNNTAQDGTPYFLSANHCMGGGTNNWVFKFDYERPGCANSGGPAVTGGNFTQGATIRASNAGSDFALLQLNSAPPAGHSVYYAGWDRSGNAPSSSVCIHHPSGDRKKITFDNNAATQGTFSGAACWRIATWEAGTTEPGSSGSPLFDQNKRIIGQLYGGSANCTNNVDDYYGRFNVSWDGNSASTRLKDWLDPTNSGVTTLDGYDPNATSLALDAQVQNIGGVASGATLCTNTLTPTVTLRNRGISTLTSATINWTVNGAAQTAVNWTGSLTNNQTAVVTLPQVTLSNGANTIAFTVTSPNGGADENATNNSVSVSFTVVNGAEMSVVIRTDNYPEETSWEIRNASNVVVASGSGYDNSPATLLTIPTCLPNGCYTFTIFDSYDDGICCQFGQGYFELLSPDGAEMGTGAEFAGEESVQFCLPFGTNSVSEALLAESIRTYPNPASGELTIDLPMDRAFTNIVLTDITGRVTREIPVTRSERMTVDLSGLAEGAYHLTFITAESRVTKKVMIIRP
jgi:lysyl endopeptidase